MDGWLLRETIIRTHRVNPPSHIGRSEIINSMGRLLFFIRPFEILLHAFENEKIKNPEFTPG